jgi:peptide/nickel transport system substrate-binding protein
MGGHHKNREETIVTDRNRRALMQASAAAAATSLFGIPEQVLAQAARGGTFVMGLPQSPRSLNPAIQSGAAVMIPGAQLFATPLKFDAKWQPQPFLAERWILSDDARSVTLFLRKDAKFHDGRPITSADVQFSVETVRDNHPFKSMFGPVNGVTLTDAHTAVIRLSEPHPALLLAMSSALLPILPKHIFGDGQPIATHPRNGNPVGSGPFKLVEFKPGEHVILERFDGFFLKDRPMLDRFIVRFFRDPASMLLALERGEIDAHTGLVDAREIERAKKIPGIQFYTRGGPAIGSLNWVAINNRHPQLSDKRVRQAIAYALDKQFILKSLLGGVHDRATGPIAAASPFYSADVEKYDLNLQKAAALLDAAGLKPKADGTRLALNIDYLPGVADAKVIAEYAKPALAKVGIDVTVRASPDFATWVRRTSTFNYDLSVDTAWNWGDPVIGVHRTYLSSNIREGVPWSNTQGYQNPKVDELLAQAGRERDVNKRKQFYREFQKIVVDDCPVIYIHETNFHAAYQRKVANPPTGIWGTLESMDELALRKA